MRKIWKLTFILLVASATTCGVLPLHADLFELTVPTAPDEKNKYAEEAVDSLEFQKVDFTNATWQDMAAFFQAEYARGTMTFRPVYLKIYAPTTKTFTLHLSNVSSRTVLESACYQTGASYALVGEEAIILPNEASKNQYLASAEFRLRLASIIIPIFSNDRIDGTNIDRTLKYLNTESKRVDPTHRGIIFLSNLPPHWREENTPNPHGPIHHEASNYGDLTLSDILNIMLASGLTCTIKPERNEVVVSVPEGTQEPTFQK